MKRLLCFLWICASMSVYAQTNPPIWVHDVYRRINYPPEYWHTGYAQSLLNANDEAGSKLKMLERDAINRLAESIIVTVESETQVENTGLQSGLSGESGNAETAAVGYRQKVTTFTSATLVNLDVYSYHDLSTGMLYAFAAIKRSDLSAYYQKQLSINLTEAEAAIEIIKQQLAAGKKSSARSKIKEAKRLLEDAGFYRTIISRADTDAGAVQPHRENELLRVLNNFNTDILIAVNCRFEKQDAFIIDPDILCDMITQALNENGYMMTDDVNKADFELTLIASTGRRSDGNDAYGIISCYANAKVSLYDRTEQRRVSDFSIIYHPQVYAAGRSLEDAAIKAFKLPVLRNMILDNILTTIN